MNTFCTHLLIRRDDFSVKFYSLKSKDFLIDTERFLIPIFALKMSASSEEGIQFCFHKCYKYIFRNSLMSILIFSNLTCWNTQFSLVKI